MSPNNTVINDSFTMFLRQKTQSNGQPANVAPQDVTVAVLKLKKDKVMLEISIHTDWKY